MTDILVGDLFRPQPGWYLWAVNTATSSGTILNHHTDDSLFIVMSDVILPCNEIIVMSVEDGMIGAISTLAYSCGFNLERIRQVLNASEA